MSLSLALSSTSSQLSSLTTTELPFFIETYNESLNGNLTEWLLSNFTTDSLQLDPLAGPRDLHPRALAIPSVREAPDEAASSIQAVVLLSLLFCVIGTIGIAGNVMIVAVIVRDRKLRRSVTNLFIVNLAVADFCGTLFAVPEIIQFMLNRGWVLGLGLCKCNRFILVCSLYASILTLMAISVERYVAIIHPFTARIACSRRRTVSTIALIWPTAALCGLPTLLYNDVVIQPPAHTIPLCKIVLPGEQMEGNAAFKITESLLFFFLPVLLQLGLYALVIRRLFARSSILQAQINIELGRHGTLRRHRGRRRQRANRESCELSEGSNRDSSSSGKSQSRDSDKSLPNIPEDAVPGRTFDIHSSSSSSQPRRVKCGGCWCCWSTNQQRADSRRALNINIQTGESSAGGQIPGEQSLSKNICCLKYCFRSNGEARMSAENGQDGECQQDRVCHSGKVRNNFGEICNRLCLCSCCTRAPVQIPPRSPTNEALKTRQGVIKMLVATLLVYIISYAPLQVPTFYNIAASVPFHVSWTFVVMVMILTYINSAANPLLYAIFSQNFRRHFTRLLLCNRPEGQARDLLRTDVFSASRQLRKELEEGAASARNGIRNYSGNGSIRRTHRAEIDGEDYSSGFKNRDSFRVGNRDTALEDEEERLPRNIVTTTKRPENRNTDQSLNIETVIQSDYKAGQYSANRWAEQERDSVTKPIENVTVRDRQDKALRTGKAVTWAL